MDDSRLDKTIIERTIADLQGVISRLTAEMGKIEAELNETQSACRYWQEILRKIENAPKKPRAKKGENAAIIVAAYRSNGSADSGYTLTELTKLTGLSWSSVRNVLTKSEKDKFEEREEGRYYLRGQQN